jgi:ClpP class serine protease
MIKLNDLSGYYEQAGIKEHVINATDSSGKNASYYAALQGDYAPLRAETLDPLNQVFLDSVTERRGSTIPAKMRKEVLGGKTWFGQDAIDRGLADEIGTLEHTAQRLVALAADPTSARRLGAAASATSSSPNPVFFKNKYPKTSALAGMAAADITPELVAEANAELVAAGITAATLVSETQAIEAEARIRAEVTTAANAAATAAATAASAQELSCLVEERDQADTRAERAEAAATTAAEQLAAMTAERDAAIAQRDEYGALAGVEPTTVVPAGEESEISESAKDTINDPITRWANEKLGLK